MSEDDTLTVETDGESYAKIRVDDAMIASVEVVDKDQVKAKLYEIEHEENVDAIDVWFIDRPDSESAQEEDNDE